MKQHSTRTGHVVTFGEVLLRLSTPGFSRFTQAQQFDVNFGGAEANVAVSLKKFGLTSAHVTRLPDHDLGVRAVQELSKHGVQTDSIVMGDGRMGLYYLENGTMQRSSRIIYDRFDSAFSKIDKDEIEWEKVLDGASWFHYTGITPAISQGAADACLQAVKTARKMGVTISGDINYRRNLWQYGKSAQDVMPALIELTDVVIAGITDMENCCDVTGSSYEDACVKMQKKFPAIQKIATTVRDSVSSSYNRIGAELWNGSLLQSRYYDLTHIVDRIGAGDSFMAGLIYGLLTKKDDQRSLEFAAAACALKHGIEGDVNLSTAEEVEHLLKGENVGKLLR